jgi:acetyl esterase/lipase
MGGLPSKSKLSKLSTTTTSSSSTPEPKPEPDYHNLPQPSEETIVKCSPRAQIVRGNYHTPTFLVHGTNDELIPYQQTEGTYRELVKRGVPAGLRLVEGAPHICDLSSDVESEGWKAVMEGYEFLASFV